MSYACVTTMVVPLHVRECLSVNIPLALLPFSPTVCQPSRQQGSNPSFDIAVPPNAGQDVEHAYCNNFLCSPPIVSPHVQTGSSKAARELHSHTSDRMRKFFLRSSVCVSLSLLRHARIQNFGVLH